MANSVTFFSVLLCTTGVVLADPHGITWSYSGEHGPEHWYEIDPVCGGSEQSPIDIVPAAAVPEKFQPIFVVNYEAKPKSVTVKNNGHTAVLSMDTDRIPYVADGGLIGKYNFAQMHFHWGSNSSLGSEHTMKGSRYAAELHLVHWNKKYEDFTSALGNTDGLTVLGVFIKATNEDNPRLTSIIEMLADVKESGSNSTKANIDFALKDVLPKDMGKFYRYHGSLTTPGCNEVVFWTVFDTPITASEKQLATFRQLMTEEHTPLVNNYRPVQPLKTRTVHVRSGSSFASASILTIVVTSILRLSLQ